MDAAELTAIGTDSECYLTSKSNGLKFTLKVASSSQTCCDKVPIVLTLNYLTPLGCTAETWNEFNIRNLPIETPDVIFRANFYNVPKCMDNFMLDITQSKGLTYRDITIVWSVSLLPSAGPLEATINTLLATFVDKKKILFDRSIVESLAGYVGTFSAVVNNCFGNS
jgi:hypothetical protein